MFLDGWFRGTPAAGWLDAQEARSVGVRLQPPPPRQNYAIPLLFSGVEILRLAVPAGAAVGTRYSFRARSTPITYLCTSVRGLKVVGWLSRSLLSDGSLSVPRDVAALDESAQVGIVVDMLRVDGGLNLLAGERVVPLGGPFGASDERVMIGIREEDEIPPTAEVLCVGYVELAFDVQEPFTVALHLATVGDIVLDAGIGEE